MFDFLPEFRMTASMVIPLILLIGVGFMILTQKRGKTTSSNTKQQFSIKNFSNYLVTSVVIFLISIMLFESQSIADFNYTIHEIFSIFINASFIIIPLIFAIFLFYVVEYFINKVINSNHKGDNAPIMAILVGIISFGIFVVTLIVYL